MLTARSLTRRYGRLLAVDDLTFDVPPGRVTGFMGANGAGKSTTLRMFLGLETPTSGAALVDGKRYGDQRHPLQQVGALLETPAVHPGRTAELHLRWVAQSNDVARRRVAEVLDLTGLTTVAHRRVGTYSLGMRQRLGIAAALLGDPEYLLLDEPVNGLDPEGIVWIRQLMRGYAAQGRTVLVSSHLLSELALTADHLLVISQGRLVADAALAELQAHGQSLEQAFLRLTAAEPSDPAKGRRR